MADKSKQALRVENNQSFPDNNSGFITPDKLRTFQENIIDSFVNNEDSGSLTFDTGSLLTTASATNDTIQFTKGDGSTFDVTLTVQADSSSLVTTSSFNEYTQSTDDRLTNIELETSSLDGRVSSIELETASLETKFDTLATTTSSLQNFTASADNRLTNIESNTGSYARVDTTNQFQETQTLEQDLVVQGNLYVSGAEVIISSSELIVGDRIIEVNANKVIGDAGLYAFDAIGDQTGSLIWNPTLDYWLAGLSGSEEKVLVSSDTGSITNSITNLETFTQSAEGRLDNIELTTQSLEEKNNTLETFTQSLYETASNDFSEITLTKVDGSTQVLDVTPRQVVESVKNGNGQQLLKGTPVYASGSVGNAQLVFPASASDATTMPAVYILAQTLDPDEEGLGYTHGFINGVNTSLFDAGDEIYVGVNGGYTNTPPTGSTNFIQKLGTVVRSDVNNGSGVIQIDSIRGLPNIEEGYAWVGDSDGVPQSVSTSSWDAQSDLTSLNAFTASADNRLNNLESETGSYLREGDEVISGSITSGFIPVATGEHSLGNSVASINSQGVFAVGSIANPLPFPQIQMRTDSDGGSSYAAYQLIDEGSGSATAQLELTTFDSIYGSGNPVNRLRMGSNTGQHPDGNVVFVAPIDTSDVQWYKDALFTQGTNIRLEDGDIEVSGSILSDGDLDIQGTFTSSLTEGYVLVGDSNNRTYEVSTGSFSGGSTDISSLNSFTASAEIRLTNLETFTSSQETTNTELFASSSIFAEKFDTIGTQSGSWGGGGGGFPYEGDAQISGSLGVTGSFSGDVVTLTAVSSTASINMNDGNFFTLDIPTGTTTHIDFTNIRPGQVINLQTTQPTTTGSLEFSPSVKFAGGYPFIATTTGSAIDFITFVSLDGTNILGTGIKNFL